jgi:hypothetical protein
MSSRDYAVLSDTVYRLAEHSRALRSTQVQLHAQLKQQAKQKKREVNRLWAVAFTLFVWSLPNSKLGLHYLRVKGDTLYAHQTDEELDAALAEQYLAWPLPRLNQIYEQSGYYGKAVFADATAFSTDLHVLKWVENMNLAQGIAPSYRMAGTFRDTLAAGPADSREPLRLKRGAVASSKWVQRFRKRWRLGLEKIAPLNIMPKTILQEKVLVSDGSRNSFTGAVEKL